MLRVELSHKYDYSQLCIDCLRELDDTWSDESLFARVDDTRRHIISAMGCGDAPHNRAPLTFTIRIYEQ